MSYVITIKRSDPARQILPQDLEALLKVDPSLAKNETTTLQWIDPETSETLWINIEPDELWTDGVRGPAENQFIEKMRSIAIALDARVYGEEGEDLTNDFKEEFVGPRSIFAVMGGLLIAMVSLPFLVLLCLVRIPWILWKILRLK